MRDDPDPLENATDDIDGADPNDTREGGELSEDEQAGGDSCGTTDRNLALFKQFKIVFGASTSPATMALLTGVLVLTAMLEMATMGWTMFQSKSDGFDNLNAHPLLVIGISGLSLCLFFLIKCLGSRKWAAFLVYLLLFAFVFKGVWKQEGSGYMEMFSDGKTLSVRAEAQLGTPAKDEPQSASPVYLAVAFAAADTAVRTVPGWLFVLSCSAFGKARRNKRGMRLCEAAMEIDGQAAQHKASIQRQGALRRRLYQEKDECSTLATSQAIQRCVEYLESQLAEIEGILASRVIEGQELMVLQRKLGATRASLAAARTLRV